MPLIPAALLLSLAPPPAQDVPPTQEEARPASLAGMADQGRFTLFLNEEPIAHSSFTWEADGSYEGSSTLAVAGQKVETRIRIEVDQEGVWTRIAMETPRGPVEVTREGGEAVIQIAGLDEPRRTALKEGCVLWEDFQPALVRLAVQAYDQAAGGRQQVPVLLVPAMCMEVPLERLESVERAVAGRDLRLTRYSLKLMAVEVYPWVDEEGRVYRIEVPAQYVNYLREGYEGLRFAEEEDPLLSRPEHDWVLRDEVMVPMRDGVRLATDLYLPDGEGPWPVILVRTPYKKEMSELQGKYYARRGYAFALQDCRGRFGSEGDWVPFFHEPEDGHDTIEWLAAQPWCNGRVGTIGGSYLGWVQWWAARERPPHLVTMIPNVAPPDPWFNIPYEYGCFFLTGAIWWANVLEQEATADLSGEAMRRVMEADYRKRLLHLPVIELDEIVLGKKSDYWRSWIAHPDNDAWWGRASFLDHLEAVDIPVFHQSGWFDGDGIGSKLNHARMSSHGHGNQKLVLGPWGHTDTATRAVGDMDFGPEAVVDLQRAYLRWFDRWLKGVENGIEDEPLVSLFVMGSNRWLHGDTYPLEGTEMQRWYLHSGGQANTAEGRGSLSPAAPGAEPPDRYTYDPGDPTPSPQLPPEEGESEEAEAAEGGEEAPATAEGEEPPALEPSGPDAREARTDHLVYRTEPFQEPLTFAGPLTAVLYAASDARDTDWFVWLGREDAQGDVRWLAEGKIRARYRNSHSAPELLTPGEIARYEIDCWQTGLTVQPGERLRVEVASASFPLFSRNLNTGGHNETETEFVAARQTIYHDAEHPSHLLLPVIPNPRWGE